MTGGGLSSVDLGGLLKTAQGQETALQDGQAQLNQAVSHAETLSSTWTGEAATQFHSALGHFNDNGNKVLNALQAMHNAMSNTHDTFSNAHNATTDRASGAIRMTSQTPGLPGL